MSHQQPIFNTGLFGKANHIVCNQWTESASTVAANVEGIAWAQQQVVGAFSIRKFLAKVVSASSIGDNRWVYGFVPFAIDGTSPIVLDGTFGNSSAGQVQQIAINLREMTNDLGWIDGSPTDGNIDAGPFGSYYEGTEWVMDAGYCEMTIANKKDGSALFWFSEPNPIRCISQSEFSPPPGDQGEA